MFRDFLVRCGVFFVRAVGGAKKQGVFGKVLGVLWWGLGFFWYTFFRKFVHWFL